MEDPQSGEEPESGTRAQQANRKLGLAGLDMNLLLGKVKQQVLGLHAPTKISRFELERRLGAGAMGVVYLAADPQLDRKVALKHLHPNIIESGDVEGARRRLQREAKAMARLTHPNVVAVYEFGADGDKLFIAMEFVDGCTMRDWLSAKVQPWTQVLEHFLAAGEGLVAAHEAGLVHRDFKPENVLLSTSGDVKVSDFGLASAVMDFAQFEVTKPDQQEASEPMSPMSSFGSLPAALSATGVVLGTPAYMAPERYQGSTANAFSDQFSFCVALYEGLVGRRPFVGETYGELAKAITKGELLARPRRSPVPSWLLDVVERGLAVDAKQRWGSMRELIAALRNDPRRRRWRLVGAGLVIAGFMAAAGYAVVQYNAHEEAVMACEVAGEEIRAQWGPERRRAWEVSMQLPMLVKEVADQLDDYSTHWSEVRRDLCVTAHVRERWEPELTRAAERCLETRRAWMGMLVDSFGDAEDSTAWHLSREIMVLPSPEICADPAYLRELPALPPEHAEIQAQLAKRFAQVELLLVLQHKQAAVSVAMAAVEEARALDWPALLARAQAVLGMAYMRAEQPHTAIPVFEQAFFLSLEHGNTTVAVDAALSLARLSRPGRMGPQTSRRWLRHAQLLLDKLERPAPEQEDRLIQERMSAALMRAEPHEAIELAQAQLARLEPRLGAQHPHVTRVYFTLGLAYMLLGDTQRSIELLEQTLELQHPLSGDSHGQRSQLLLALAEAHVARNELNQAQARLEQARALSITGSVRYGGLTERLARISEELGKHERARELYLETVAAYEEHIGSDLPQLGPVLLGLARTQAKLGQLEQAQANYERALTIHDKWRGLLDTQVAWELRDRARELVMTGELEAALSLYAEALELQNRDVQPLPFNGLPTETARAGGALGERGGARPGRPNQGPPPGARGGPRPPPATGQRHPNPRPLPGGGAPPPGHRPPRGDGPSL